MKRGLCFALMILMLYASCTFASAESEGYDYAQIWESLGVSSSEEMYAAYVAYMDRIEPEFAKGRANVRCNIRCGATTKELLANWKDWDLAIVSSKEVNLAELVRQRDLIEKYPVSLSSDIAHYQYRVSEQLRELLPKSKKWNYRVYFYDYDAQNDEAIMLVCNGKQKGFAEYSFTSFILDKRPVEMVRRVEGIRQVLQWTIDDMLAAPNDWDVACITVEKAEELEPLVEAGLLYDFSQQSCFALRQPYQRRDRDWRAIPMGLFSADGKMVAMPYFASYRHQPESYQVLLVNAQSAYLDAAISYAEKFIQSWNLHTEKDDRGMKTTAEDIFEIWGIRVDE